MTDRTRKVMNIILALAVSLAAWIFVVYNYDPMTSEKYSGIPVTYTGLQTLADRGYAVTEQSRATVDVTLLQRRIDTGNFDADDISVTADVSNLATGENTVALSVKAPDGTTVSDTSIKTVTINIESADSVDMPITVEYSEASADGAVPVVEEISTDTATVIATETKLTEIDRIAAVVEPDDLDNKPKPLTVQLAAFDKDGRKVLNVVIAPETVSFRAFAGFSKTVDLNVPVKNEESDSYDRTYAAPETVTIKGSRGALDRIASLTAEELDIGQFYEDTDAPIEFVLPEGVYLDESEEAPVLRVKVKEKKEGEGA